MNSIDKMEDYDRLKQERDELAAQVEVKDAALRKIASNPSIGHIHADGDIGYLTESLSIAGHAALREIQAQAREEGRKEANRDADRYQYIRRDCISHDEADYIACIIRDNAGVDLDAAIDAEMLAAAPKPECREIDPQPEEELCDCGRPYHKHHRCVYRI